ncbi:MAG: hypothetical protein QM733_09365 [Ilumatobacteraceae bacterium]
MLFSADAWPGLADGSITLTFRTWTRPQAKAGGRYRVGGLLLEATAVELVATATITALDAQRAGSPSLADLLRRLGDAGEVWRVELRCLGRDDRIERRESADLDDEQLAQIRARLARLDRDRPWTATTLHLIERYPGIVSTKLAQHAGMERPAFKLNVRKLKELGLTESLDIGYRLSPRGQVVLRALGR